MVKSLNIKYCSFRSQSRKHRIFRLKLTAHAYSLMLAQDSLTATDLDLVSSVICCVLFCCKMKIPLAHKPAFVCS